MRAESKGTKFCCCCPLKAGIYLIAFTFFIVATIETLSLLCLIFNLYIDGYYIGISFLLLVPLYIACILFIIFMRSKKRSDRFQLKVGCILATISIALLYLWTLIYFGKCYEYPVVYHGVGDKEDESNYTSYSKTQYLMETILIGLSLSVTFGYFILVADKWEILAEEEEQ